MRLELKPRVATGAITGVAYWNPDTGDIRCNDPVIEGDLCYLIQRARKLGCIHTHPHPNCIRCTDPTHDRMEFAAICGTFWEVPDPLKPFYPTSEADLKH